MLKNRNLPKIVKEKTGSAILIFQFQHIRRLLGTLDHLVYSSTSPHLVEISPGHFEEKGDFKNNGSFIQRMASRFCIPYLFCSTLMSKFYSKPNEEQIALAARLIDSIEKMYREQFAVESFKIFWLGSDDDMRVFRKFSKIQMIRSTYDKLDDGHPSAKGAQEIVNFLFTQKIIY